MKKPALGGPRDRMGFLLSLLLKPFYALLFLQWPYAASVWLWRRLPDSRVKCFLFKSYGRDNGPWTRSRPTHTVQLIDRDHV